MEAILTLNKLIRYDQALKAYIAQAIAKKTGKA
jgi:hypothetical protein